VEGALGSVRDQDWGRVLAAGKRQDLGKKEDYPLPWERVGLRPVAFASNNASDAQAPIFRLLLRWATGTSGVMAEGRPLHPADLISQRLTKLIRSTDALQFGLRERLLF
jgi:hypothetical protein